jgi:hypothetical protein
MSNTTRPPFTELYKIERIKTLSQRREKESKSGIVWKKKVQEPDASAAQGVSATTVESTLV